MFTDVVILAGGFGERLWPASSSDFPKQFMSLEGGVSFFQSSVLRAISLNISGNILVVTRKDLENTIIQQISILFDKFKDKLSFFDSSRIIIISEPFPIHTAAPVTISSHLLNKIEPTIEHSILVMTSDHVIGPITNFIEDCKVAYIAAQKDNVVCFSIIPTNPSTGYGYIKSSDCVIGLENFNNIKKIDEFKEKPNLETAKKYLESGNYTWNSGMFGFKTKTYLSELSKCEPEAYFAFVDLEKNPEPKFKTINNFRVLDFWQGLEEMYKNAPHISIDNALAEKTQKACTVKASFSWEDVGSWDTFEKLFSKNEGKVATVESENCFVYSDIPVALCGVKDLIVVVKNNKLLVIKKGYSDIVKEAVHILEKEEK